MNVLRFSDKYMGKIRTLLIAIAYLGILIMIVGSILAFRYSIFDFTQHVLGFSNDFTRQIFNEATNPYSVPIWYELNWEIPLIITGVGVLLALIGGFIARLRYIGMRLILLGAISILSFSGVFYFAYGFYHGIGLKPNETGHLLLFLLPGLACIIGGIILHSLKVKRI